MKRKLTLNKILEYADDNCQWFIAYSEPGEDQWHLFNDQQARIKQLQKFMKRRNATTKFIRQYMKEAIEKSQYEKL